MKNYVLVTLIVLLNVGCKLHAVYNPLKGLVAILATSNNHDQWNRYYLKGNFQMGGERFDAQLNKTVASYQHEPIVIEHTAKGQLGDVSHNCTVGQDNERCFELLNEMPMSPVTCHTVYPGNDRYLGHRIEILSNPSCTAEFIATKMERPGKSSPKTGTLTLECNDPHRGHVYRFSPLLEVNQIPAENPRTTDAL